MPITSAQFDAALSVLFSPEIDTNNSDDIANAAAAYQNLAMRFIEMREHALLDHVFFDPLRMALMLRRFHRDGFGVAHFHDFLENRVAQGLLSAGCKEEIKKGIRGLSIRINSELPRKIRIAAAFSLWALTLRPICIRKLGVVPSDRLWRLDATINFWIATEYLKKFGSIQIGVLNNHKDFQIRLNRVWYDFTFRAINLSSLEMMYSSIFRPL